MKLKTIQRYPQRTRVLKPKDMVMQIEKSYFLSVRYNVYLKCLFFKWIILSPNFFYVAPHADIEQRLQESIQSQVGKHLSTRGKINFIRNKGHILNKFVRKGKNILYWNLKAKDRQLDTMERRHARPLEILNAIPLLGTIIQMPAVRIRKNVALTRATVIPIQSAMARLYVNWTAVLPTKGSESVQAAASSLVAHM